ncbi:MFS transporter (plasmid) [Agrobacterium leguminum]|uniref:Sugar phosphate permease n=1 Tax=Agrobacterium deltaense NCPPB 1641 TaxID=1183425 RepID=A0A1S7U6V2_9HYPH|nr:MULTISPECIES: MFS transporter [Agrobacterium]WFS69799.1 MFS transporter [Agrobacterium leguminum]CVI62583.1 Sugar phosphate permease [Agrobacterium deltaense NCPPB 1641]
MSATTPDITKLHTDYERETISPMAKRATMSSAFGSALEWLDFTAYGAISATVLPALFFPTMDENSALLASFATFGVGFFARPAGGIVMGILGDKIGRKKILLFTFILMGVASFLIGLMPTYATIGVWAPGLIVVLRFIQGFALGGESTGAQLFTMEHAPSSRRGLFAAFTQMAAPASQVLSNALLYVISLSMNAEQFLSFGWRIPFLMSVLLVALGVYIRFKVEETPAFQELVERRESEEKVTKAPVKPKPVFKSHPGTILRLLLFWGAPTACYYVVTVFSISYLTKTIGLESQTAFVCLMAANVVAMVTTCLGGAASDRFGRKPPLIVTSITMIAVALVYFPVISTGNTLLIFIAMALFAGSIQAQSGILPAFFAEHFPTAVRYAGSAASYTGANLVFAAPTPLVAAWLMQKSGGQVWILTVCCLALLAISFTALLLSPETRHNDLSR